MDLRTCPTWLRVAQSPDRKARRGFDALDQPEDVPEPDEWLHVYRIVPGTWSLVFACPGGRYENAEYQHVEVTPERCEQLRQLVPWRAFAALMHFTQLEAQHDVPAALAAELGRITEAQFVEAAPAIGGREVAPGVWRLEP